MSGRRNRKRRKRQKDFQQHERPSPATESHDEAPPGRTKRPIFAIGFELIGIALSVTAVSEACPLYINFGLVLIAVAFILLGFREATKENRMVVKSAVPLAVALVYLFLMTFPLVKQYNEQINLQLSFKEPVDLSFFRQQLIRYDIARFRDFLSRLDIPVPPGVPVIAITQSTDPCESGSSTLPGLSYRDQLEISKIAAGNRECVTTMYSGFVMDSFLSKAMGLRNDMPSVMTVFLTFHSLNFYFEGSFWGHRPPHMFAGPIFDALWIIREQKGRKFADLLAGASVRTMINSPGEVLSDDQNVYAVRSLMIGDSMVETSCETWPNIEQILIKVGFDRNLITSQRFSSGAAANECIAMWQN